MHSITFFFLIIEEHQQDIELEALCSQSVQRHDEEVSMVGQAEVAYENDAENKVIISTQQLPEETAEFKKQE